MQDGSPVRPDMYTINHRSSIFGRGQYSPSATATGTSVTYQLAFQVPANVKHVLVYNHKPIAFSSIFRINKRTRFAALLGSLSVVIRKALIYR